MNKRYSRNIACIGTEGQQRLSCASVFIIGCGALGGQVAMLMAGAGIGRIGIADFDTIDISNLQRQLFFKEIDAGNPKVEMLANAMRGLNSDIVVDTYNRMIRQTDGPEILKDYDFIIDATDNPASKYMTDRICAEIGKPCCIGGVAEWSGQVITLCAIHGDGIRFADIFPKPDLSAVDLPCEVRGVMGAAASTVASLQAAEVIKRIVDPKNTYPDSMITIDLKTMNFNTYPL